MPTLGTVIVICVGLHVGSKLEILKRELPDAPGLKEWKDVSFCLLRLRASDAEVR